MNLHNDRPCPTCSNWIEILATTPDEFLCPWCHTKLRKTLSAYTDETQREMMIVTVEKTNGT